MEKLLWNGRYCLHRYNYLLYYCCTICALAPYSTLEKPKHASFVIVLEPIVGVLAPIVGVLVLKLFV